MLDTPKNWKGDAAAPDVSEYRVPMAAVASKRRTFSILAQLAVALAIFGAALTAHIFLPKTDRGGLVNAKAIDPAKTEDKKFHPTAAQWAALTVQTVEMHRFRAEHRTEGKIAVNEDHATPIFSLYAGRVSKLVVSPGDVVQRGQPLFVLEATDSVQAQNDFIAALTGVNKARTQLHLAETVEQRLQNLYKATAIPLKDWQQSQADLTSAQNDLRSAQTTLEAMRNRLRILGKTDAEITAFEQTGTITTESVVHAPLGGTIVQRKAGPGQYITAGSADPVFVIGDLSTVWLIAFVREYDAPKMKMGQPIRFTVLAYPDRVFEATISYIPTALESTSRRLLVRATIDNAEGLLKPEMFATVSIMGSDGGSAIAVPREAVIYEGDIVRVWVARDDQAVELRQIKLGLSSGRLLQVLDGLKAGDKVITKGGLFIDRMSESSPS
jgi:cobalt-zinc-cadmium efflux system membrane fusion protein